MRDFRLSPGMKKKQLQEVLDLFEWSKTEGGHLSDLKLKKDKEMKEDDLLNMKKFKHLCYLFETTYAVAINPYMDVTGAPTYGWQLGFPTDK